MKKGFKKHFTTARLVGIITLVLATILQVSGMGSKLLFAAAAIILLAPTNYAQKRLELIAEIDGKKILTTALYESLFWALLLISGYAAVWIMRKIAEQAGLTTTPGQQAMLNPATATQNLANAQSLVLTFLGLIVFLFIFNILNSALTRSLIWSTLADTKWNKKYFFSFIKLTAAWWALWAVPFVVIAIALSKNAPVLSWAITMLGTIGIYFTFFIHTTFLQRKKVGTSISHGIAFALSKFYHLIVPLSFALVIYVIAYQALRAVQFLPAQAMQPIMIAFALLYFSWLRAYVYSTLPKFED